MKALGVGHAASSAASFVTSRFRHLGASLVGLVILAKTYPRAALRGRRSVMILGTCSTLPHDALRRAETESPRTTRTAAFHQTSAPLAGARRSVAVDGAGGRSVDVRNHARAARRPRRGPPDLPPCRPTGPSFVAAKCPHPGQPLCAHVRPLLRRKPADKREVSLAAWAATCRRRDLAWCMAS